MSKFVFGEYFVLFGWVFCNVFAEWAKWAKLEGGGRGGAEKIARAEGPQAIFGALERPEPSSEASVANGAKTLQNILPKKQKTHQQMN